MFVVKDKTTVAKKEKEVVLAPIDETPKGMKKIISNTSDIASFPAAYFPVYVESAWQEW